jgi:3-isopropylmalate dehydrogenase
MIAVLGGDGIGPEVTAEAVRVLRAVADGLEFVEAPVGGCAIDRTGNALPDETLALCRRSDAVLFGAVGGPTWEGGAPERGLLALRKELGLFANIRPVAVHPSLIGASTLKPEVLRGVDLVVVRELTGGLYFGRKSRDGERAVDECVYTVAEVERVARVAFRLARARRKSILSVDKANVLETSRLWRETVTRVSVEFPDVKLAHALVDSTAMELVRRPSSFDVILTENMFGDILTDEAAVLAGSIGMLPSASLGSGTLGLYEPIHGSAPDIAGRGAANPYGAILSAAMLLRHSLGLEREATSVESAVASAIEAGVRTMDIGGHASTAEAGEAVARLVR